jgi:cell division protein FtsW (lipid II flippase)
MSASRIGQWLWRLLTPFPALIVGALVMRQHDVPSSRWGLNLIGGVLSAAICAVFLARSRTAMSKTAANISAWLAAGALAATFAMAGSMGVHRWIPVGPMTVHAGAICLPVLIVALGVLDAFGGTLRWAPLFLAVSVAMLLLLQPDAAQATAFAGAAFTLLIANDRRARAAWAAALVIAVLAAWTWMRPDPLSPVPYVEGIVGLARQSGPAWLVASIAALAVLPLPFSVSPLSRHSAVARALGVYLGICILAPLFGPFPVPLVGFGLSPIVGYFVALANLRSGDSRSVVRDEGYDVRDQSRG